MYIYICYFPKQLGCNKMLQQMQRYLERASPLKTVSEWMQYSFKLILYSQYF